MAAMALEQKRAFTSKMLLGTVVRCRNKRNLAGGARRNDSRPKRRRMGTGMSHVKNAARLRALKKTVEQMNRDRVCYMTAVPRKELREGRVLVITTLRHNLKFVDTGFGLGRNRRPIGSLSATVIGQGWIFTDCRTTA